MKQAEEDRRPDEDTDYTDEQGGGGEGEKPLTKEELFEQLDKVIKADPSKERQSPDEENSKT